MDIRDLLFLSSIPGIGPVRIRALISHFRTPGVILGLSARELVRIPGMDRKAAVAITSMRHSPERVKVEKHVDSQLARLRRAGARIVTLWDPDYPENLRRIFDPPTVLFVRGSFAAVDRYSVAIVGTRNPSSYGRRVADLFAGQLSSLGIPVVSGLARGIDTEAHRAAVRQGGRTVAVIGSGVDVIYPAENAPLAETIVESGALVSECAMGAKPDAVNFPRRNRIISGMSLGTVVVETGPEGGAMITANLALDQDREVFAIPAPVGEGRATGTNTLVKLGKAHLTDSIDDILEELAPRLRGIPGARIPQPRVPEPDLTLFERRVFDVLTESPAHIDDVARLAELAVSDTLVHLLGLEFRGVVRQLPGKMFLRS